MEEQSEEQYSQFERAIRKTGCWDEHLASAECMEHTRDWRECKEELEKFKICMQSYMKDKLEPSAKNSSINSTSLKDTMLSELFAELEIDSDDCGSDSRSAVNYTDPYVYVPLDQSPRWFLDDNLYLRNNDDITTREILQNRAAFAYVQGDYITAMDIYFSLLKKETKNGLNKSMFALVDSVIRSGLKTAPINGPQLLSLLQKLCSLVSTYDEQLQYWVESLEVYLATGINTPKYLRNAILLCASVDLPEFWISISKNAPVSFYNLRIGSLCRAVSILENLPPSKARCLDSELERMKTALERLCNKKKLSEARAAVCNDLIGMPKAMRMEVNRQGVLKDKKAEDIIILEFIDRFYWLFTDMNQQTVHAALQVT